MKLIGKMSKNSCDLDPIPASLPARCLQRSLLPLITRTLSSSLDSAVMPSTLKNAQLPLLLKRSVILGKLDIFEITRA